VFLIIEGEVVRAIVVTVEVALEVGRGWGWVAQ
jgi:hypothetical protein